MEANDSNHFTHVLTISNNSTISNNFTRRWQVGAAVEARYSNGDWYRAKIVAVHVAGNTDADLPDSGGRGRSKKVRGSREERRSMQVLSLLPGERMLSMKNGDCLYELSKVSMKNGECLYELAWDDGDARETLKSGRDIRESLKSAHAIRAGGACAQEDQGCDWCAGKTSRLQSDGVWCRGNDRWVQDSLRERALENYVSALDALDYNLQPLARITTCAHIARCFLQRASSRRPRDTIPRDVGGAGGGADLCDSFPGKGERQAEDLRLTRDLRVGAGRKHGNLDSAGERMPDCAGERIRDLKWMLKNLGEALWYYKMVVFRALEDCALGTEPNVPAALVGTCYNNMACIRLRTACIIHSACHDDSNARGGKAGRGGRAGKGAGAEDETRKEFLLCLVKWRRGWSWKVRWGKQMDEYGVNEPCPSSALHPAFGMPSLLLLNGPVSRSFLTRMHPAGGARDSQCAPCLGHERERERERESMHILYVHA